MKKRFIDILNDQIIENLPKETTAFVKGGSDDAVFDRQIDTRNGNSLSI